MKIKVFVYGKRGYYREIVLVEDGRRHGDHHVEFRLRTTLQYKYNQS